MASQAAYFGATKDLAPGLVHLVEATEVETTVEEVLAAAERECDIFEGLALFDETVEWLRRQRIPESPMVRL